MLQDVDMLERDDMYILDKLKAFLTSDDVIGHIAAKQLLGLVERAVCAGSSGPKVVPNFLNSIPGSQELSQRTLL